MLRRFFLYAVFTIAVVLIVGTVITGGVIVTEHLLRYVYRDITTTADNGSWFARHWYLKELGKDLVRLNSLGYRDPEPVQPKPRERLRVLVIGDSFTFGQGISEQDRFTNLLNRRFEDDNIPIDLVNMGLSGAGVSLYVKGVDVAASLEPDFVLIQWLPNDFEVKSRGQSVFRPTPGNLIPRRWKAYHYHFHKHSVLYFVLNRGWHRLQSGLGYVGTYADYMQQRFGDESAPDSQAALRQFTRLINAYRRQNIPMGFVLFPFLDSGIGTQDYAFGFLHQRLLDLCSRRRVPCLDLRAAFDDYADSPSLLHVNQFDSHPSALAHRVAAARIRETFQPIWQPLLAQSMQPKQE